MADTNQKEHYKNLQSIKKLTAEINSMKSKSAALTDDEIKSLKKLTIEHGKLKTAIRDNNKERIQTALDASKSEESSIKSLNGIYESLGEKQRNTLDKTSKKFAETSDGWIKKTSKIGEVNRQIAQLDASDVKQLSALQNERNDLMAGTSFLGKDIQNDLAKQNNEADKFASMSENSKSVLEGQHAVLDGIKKTIQGTVETAIQLYGNFQGAIGGLISGFGVVVGKIGEANTELGTSFLQTDGVARKAGVLSLVFGDAVQNAKDLSAVLGDTNKATFELQASVGLMSTNMGISGGEATKLISAFSMLNGNSTDVALDMSKTSQEFAKQNGIIPAQLMGDLANSAEEFALFGKDGGQNILRAAGYAAKLGVNMSTISGIADGLLDFESSITKELELGAMLGKNINLNKARELAYSGDIEGATKETLKQLGGVEAFNKMDYYQKKQTADLLGVSVAELQKMNTKMENAGSLGGVISENFSAAGEAVDGVLNKALGTSLKGLGGMVTAGAQVGANFKALGLDMGGMVGSLKNGLKHLIMYPIHLAKAAAIKIGGAMGIGDGVVGKYGAGSIAAKGKDAIADKGKDLVKDKMTDSIKVPDAPKGPSMGAKLKDLAGGLKEMGNAKVLFGALNLIPTAIGFVAIIAGLPGMLGVSFLGAGAGAGLTALAGGLKLMGTTLKGSVALGLAALGFIAMIPGSIGMLMFAAAVPFAVGGITALIPALMALGAAMMSGVGALGLAALIAAGVGLGVSFALIGAGAMMMGKGIQFVAQGFTTLLPALSTFMSSITIGQVLTVGLFALSLLGLGAGLLAVGIASLFALPGLLGLSAVMIPLGYGFLLIGAGAMLLGKGIQFAAEGFTTLLPTLGVFMSTITMGQILRVGLFSLSLIGLAASLGILGIASLFALPGLIGLSFVMGMLGAGLHLVGTGLQLIGGGMGMVVAAITQLIPLIGGIVSTIAPIALLSLAFMGLAGALMFLGTAGIFALPALLGIAAASAGVAVVASMFGFGGDSNESSETTSLEAGSLSEYEANMLAKMDQLIIATTSQRDIYLDKDKVTNTVMDRGERSSVNKFKLNRA